MTNQVKNEPWERINLSSGSSLVCRGSSAWLERWTHRDNTGASLWRHPEIRGSKATAEKPRLGTPFHDNDATTPPRLQQPMIALVGRFPQHLSPFLVIRLCHRSDANAINLYPHIKLKEENDASTTRRKSLDASVAQLGRSGGLV